MTYKQTICQPQRVELFLQQQLSEDEQLAFEIHLNDCRDCQRELEVRAAGAADWQTARESLSSDDILPACDSSAISSLVPDFPHGGDDAASRHEALLGFLSPTDDPRMIGRMGGYEIVGIVGQGGMGVVLKGLDPALNRYVAIKVLSPHLAASGSARRRFAREARAAAAVTHENVIAIHGVAEWNGLPYLVMPYVRGESLQKRLDHHGPLGVQEILRVGRQMAAGLAAAHAQGLVHRDIKPANILLEDGVERLQITDFGLARAVDDASLTRTGVIAGTPQYMSPEQARGEAIDARSDLFSLGSTLYALCTGRPPFRAETSYGILRRITDHEPRPIREINPEIPDWLAAIVTRLLSKRIDARFATAAEITTVMEQCLAHVQQPTTLPLPAVVAEMTRVPPTCAPSRFTRIRRLATSRPILAGCAGLLVAGLAGWLGGSEWPLATPSASGPPANPAAVQVTPAPSDTNNAGVSVLPESLLDWNGPTQALETLRTEQERLIQRASSLWDVESQPVENTP